jgi:hypothetical protein
MTIKQISSTQKQLNDLSRNPLHACGGTFTHSTTQSIGAAGALLTFNTDIRNSGITVDATRQLFTVNTGGMFMVSLALAFNTLAVQAVSLLVNGIATDRLVVNSTNNTVGQSSIFMKYLQKNHVLSFKLDPNVAVVVQSNAEDALNESPILQICQVSPKFN